MTTDSMGRFLRDRISFMGSGEAGGTLTMIGNPVQLASNAMNNMGGMEQGMQTMSDGASNLVQAHGALPDHVSGYLAGGLLDGRSDALPGLTRPATSSTAGISSAGLELDLTEDTRVGVGVHYVDTEGQSTAGPVRPMARWSRAISTRSASSATASSARPSSASANMRWRPAAPSSSAPRPST